MKRLQCDENVKAQTEAIYRERERVSERVSERESVCE